MDGAETSRRRAGAAGAAASLLGGLLLLSALLRATPAVPPKAPAAPAPSLVLITLDTARADHFHCYGYPLPTTPAIDRLASSGALFLQAISQAVNTNPSHASLLTGLYPAAHGNRFNSTPLDPQMETLTTILSRAGYRTAAFVSGYTMIASQSGFNRGFEIYEDRFTGQDRPAAETVDKALTWLKSQPPGTPYFLFVHLFDPHGRYDPPAGYSEKFRKGKYDLLPEEAAIPDYQRLEIAGAVSRDPLEYISRYDGEILYADSQIDRILKQIGDETIVAFTADHGETLVDRDYYFSHGARLNEEAIRVPLILRFPAKGLRGKRMSGIVQLVDVLPTLLAYLRQPPPPRLAGRNLLPFLRAGVIPPGGSALSEARAAPMRLGGVSVSFPLHSTILSARGDRYKLISYPTRPQPTLELFDLEKDPSERNNVVSSDAARASSLYQALDLYRVSGRPPEPPDLDEEAKKKLRSLGYLN